MKYLILIPALALAACSTKNDVAMNYDYQLAVAETEKARMEAITRDCPSGRYWCSRCCYDDAEPRV